MNQYETVFILTPVLSDVQMKEAVEKFKGILQAEGASKNNRTKNNINESKEIVFCRRNIFVIL